MGERRVGEEVRVWGKVWGVVVERGGEVGERWGEVGRGRETRNVPSSARKRAHFPGTGI
jgi:hypothetical protein